MSTIKVNNLQDAGGGSNSTPAQIEQGRAKVWVNFNGTGTVAIRDDYNVTSITDNGTGDYTINFTNSMASANYAVCFSGETANTVARAGWRQSYLTASTARVNTANDNGTPADRDSCAVIIHGDS